jgi:hypothetical protein
MNSHQLVIRCDSTNGLYKVGWALELPLGRFQHIELLVETEDLIILNSNNPHYAIYKKACIRTSELNQSLILKEQQENQKLGWIQIELNLNDESVKIIPDDFGCFNTLALTTRYRLSKNSSEVWAVVNNGNIVQIIARYPTKKLPELEYQIWKHHHLDNLKQWDGVVNQGKLVVSFSGLWFVGMDL